MTDLLESLEAHKTTLPSASQKTFGGFLQKVRNGAYLADAKNIEKLRETADDKQIVDFLIVELKQYALRPGVQEISDHMDISRLRSAWAVLALSDYPEARDYIKTLAAHHMAQPAPWALHLIYWLLGVVLAGKHDDICEKIRIYYENAAPNLPAYQWARHIGLTLPPVSPSGWGINFILTTDGNWLAPSGISNDEKQKRMRFEVGLHFPTARNETSNIELRNEARTISGRFIDCRTFYFTDNNQKVSLQPDLLNLGEFLSAVEKRWTVTFLKKPARLDVTKGIAKKTILQWIESGMH